MTKLILRINGDLWFAVKFVLILTAFLFVASIEIPSCTDRISKYEAKWDRMQNTTMIDHNRIPTQDIPSLKVSEQR
jgi:hypothetical protein